MATWLARYPDLAGKTALLGSTDGPTLLAVTAAVAANGMHLALVGPDRGDLDAALDAAGEAEVYAVSGDPADPAIWARVVPHAEQRLGPIDLAVSIGTPEQRGALFSAVAADMSARRRGVLVGVGDGGLPAYDAPRRRLVSGGDPDDVAAAVLLCASDLLAAPTAVIQLQRAAAASSACSTASRLAPAGSSSPASSTT